MIKNAFNKMKKFALAGLAMIGLASSAHAADAESITLIAPELDWSTFAGDLMSYMTDVIVIAVGIGIGIWAFRKVYRMFKSFSR